jgi:hypothetical protein
MKTESIEVSFGESEDKQLRGICLESVLRKRHFGQALNAKEFAVCAGVSYSKARGWFRLPGFPCLQGVVFWQDFAAWRASQVATCRPTHASMQLGDGAANELSAFPARAARLLAEA